MSQYEKKIISETYYSPNSSVCFSSIPKVHNELKSQGISKKSVENFLLKQDVFTTHRSAKHKFKRRQVMTPGINYLWQGDLIVLDKIQHQNSGFRYILTLIDTFTRKARAIPLKKKDGHSVATVLDQVFQIEHPFHFEVDNGREFYCAPVKKVCEKYNVKMYSNYSEIGAAFVERFNRTLMSRLQKYMDYKKSKRYIDVLSEIVDSYNNSKNRITTFTPNSINKFNEMDVWLNAYKKLYSSRKSIKQMNVGDTVRVKIAKGTFSKGYTRKYSDSLFTISKVLPTYPPTYKLVDSDMDALNGSFYAQELSLVYKEK